MTIRKRMPIRDVYKRQDEAYRMHGIGRSMVVKAMEALKEEKINKVSLIAFMENDIGNAFWNEIGCCLLYTSASAG